MLIHFKISLIDAYIDSLLHQWVSFLCYCFFKLSNYCYDSICWNYYSVSLLSVSLLIYYLCSSQLLYILYYNIYPSSLFYFIVLPSSFSVKITSSLLLFNRLSNHSTTNNNISIVQHNKSEITDYSNNTLPANCKLKTAPNNNTSDLSFFRVSNISSIININGKELFNTQQYHKIRTNAKILDSLPGMKNKFG